MIVGIVSEAVARDSVGRYGWSGISRVTVCGHDWELVVFTDARPPTVGDQVALGEGAAGRVDLSVLVEDELPPTVVPA